jgi:5'-3' exonuclease
MAMALARMRIAALRQSALHSSHARTRCTSATLTDSRAFATTAPHGNRDNSPPVAPSAPRTLLLLDASGIIFRQYFGYKNRAAPLTASIEGDYMRDANDGATSHALDEDDDAFMLPPLSDGDGVQTERDVGALHGYVNAILHLCYELQPTHVVACLDLANRQSFRHHIYPEYKLDRKPLEEDLRWQLSQLSAVTRALGIEPVSAVGFEADDIIGTLARIACEPAVHASGAAGSGAPLFERVIILSSDKDFAQCVTASVSMLSPKNGGGRGAGSGAAYAWTHLADMPSAYGVSAHRFRDYLVLRGDPVDCIPGVKGIGEVTAKRLMSAYPDIEAIIADIRSEVKLPITSAAKIAQHLLAAEGHVDLWRQLATIRTDIAQFDGALDWDAWKYHGPKMNNITQRHMPYRGEVELNAEEQADAASAAAAVAPMRALYRAFSFPPPPAFLDAEELDDEDDDDGVEATSRRVRARIRVSSSSQSQIRIYSHAEWAHLTKPRATIETEAEPAAPRERKPRKKKEPATDS